MYLTYENPNYLPTKSHHEIMRKKYYTILQYNENTILICHITINR